MATEADKHTVLWHIDRLIEILIFDGNVPLANRLVFSRESVHKPSISCIVNQPSSS